MRLKRKIFAVSATLAVVVASLFIVYLMCPQWWGRLLYPLRYEGEIAEISSKYNLDPWLVSAIIYEESRFDLTCRSSAGAIGLMQIMPYTGRFVAKGLQVQNYSDESLLDAKINIEVGCCYLRHLIDEYGSLTLALAAYNGGRSNIDRWIKEEKGLSEREFVDSIPFPETKKFVKNVYKTKKQYEKIYPEEFTPLPEHHPDVTSGWMNPVRDFSLPG